MLQFILNGEKKSSYTKITQSSQRSLKLDNGSKCGFSGSGQYTLFQIMYYVTYKLSAIFENLLAVVILCVKLLQEPLAFLCKK